MKNKTLLILPVLLIIIGLSSPILAAELVSKSDIKGAIQRGLDFLAENQSEDGSWSTFNRGKPSAVAGLALMAMVDACEIDKDRYQDNIERALEFLEATYHPSSLYADNPWIAGAVFNDVYAPKESSDYLMYSHGIATAALIEASYRSGDTSLDPIIKDALDLILRSQNTENKPQVLRGPIDRSSRYYGGWRYKPESPDSDTSITGWQIIALRAAEVLGFNIPDWSFEAAATFTRACYDSDSGGFTYQPGDRKDGCARTAIGILTLQLCGYPDDPYINTALKYIRNNPPTWNVEQIGWSMPFYYWYYATRAMFLAGGEHWNWWRTEITSMLVENQSENGSWEAAGNESGVEVNYSTAMALLILEIAYCEEAPAPLVEECDYIFEKMRDKMREIDKLRDELERIEGELEMFEDDMERLIDKAEECCRKPLTCEDLRERICRETEAQADIVFVIDSTGTMQEKILTVYSVSESFADKLADSGIDYRLGLVEFKDYEGPGNPIDLPYKYYGMTSDINTFKEWIGSLVASGGGDIPESTLDALYHTATDVPWRKDAKRVAILISDAPPRVPEVAACGDDPTSPSGYTYEDVINMLRGRGIVAHVISYESYVDTCYDPAYAKMVQFASDTGGNFYDFNSAENVSTIIYNIGRVISCTFAIQMKVEFVDDTLKISAKITDPQGEVIEPVIGKTNVSVTLTPLTEGNVEQISLNYNFDTKRYEGEYPSITEGRYEICLKAQFCEWTETVCGEISYPPISGQINLFDKGPVSPATEGK